MYRFSPFISHPLLPFFFAVVARALASEPASVSVSAKAPVHAPDAIWANICSFVPRWQNLVSPEMLNQLLWRIVICKHTRLGKIRTLKEPVVP